jgi:hypothetical protein
MRSDKSICGKKTDFAFARKLSRIFPIISLIFAKMRKTKIFVITLCAVMGTHSFIRYFVTVTVTLLVTAVTNKFLFSSACNEVTETIEDLKSYKQCNRFILAYLIKKKRCNRYNLCLSIKKITKNCFF